LNVSITSDPGWRWGGQRRVGCLSIRESASAPLRASWLPSDPVRAWRLDGRLLWLRPWARTAQSGLVFAASPRRIASHRGAREVLEPSWCAPDSVLVAEVIEQRLAQRSHRGCGRGGGRGPSPAGRLALANDVDGSGCRRRSLGPRLAESHSMAEDVSGRGSRRSSRGGGESGLGRSSGWQSLPSRMVTEASESRQIHRPWSAKRRPGSWAQPDEAGGVT
jgi:hypothetical protein